MTVDLDLPETMEIESEPAAVEEGRKPTPRELMMQQIAAHAEEVRQEELAQSLIYDEDARAAGLTYPKDEDDEPAVEVEAKPEPEPEAKPAADNGLRKVTIDSGHQIEVTPAQYDELARAGFIAKQAVDQYYYQQSLPQPQVAPEPVAPAVPELEDELFREAVRRIQYGGEEEGTAALKNLVMQVTSRMPAAAPPVNEYAIAQAAAQMARTEAQSQLDAAKIKEEYTDIFSDPQRTKLASLNVDAIRQRNASMGQTQSDLEIFREAGNAVLDALRLPRPGSETPPALQAAQAPVRQDVIERKRAAPRLTQPIDRRSESPTPASGPSASQIVDQMRKARHQPSMM